MPANPTQPYDMHLCTTCGAWVHKERTHCPWCGTATSHDGEGTEASRTFNDVDTEKNWRLRSDIESATDETVRYALNGHQADDDDLTLTLERELWAAAPEQLAGPGRDHRFWIRAFSLTLLIVVLMLAGFGSLGIYRGLHDRQAQNQRDAIQYFEQGNALLEQGNYELAVANFREALRLEPNFEAAAYMLNVAEQRGNEPEAATESEIITEPTAETTSTPTVIAGVEGLFREAMAALEQQEWAIAAATFDTLSTQAPSFRVQEVKEGLFKARMEAGKAALEEEQLAEALRHFDHALAIHPGDEEAQQLRRVTSAYRSALRAFEAQDWGMSADQFRVVYLTNPRFLQTRELLAQAHLELGQAFEAREIWCDAAQQYRSSLAVVEDEEVSALARNATNRCNLRTVAQSATSTREVNEVDDDVIYPRSTSTPVIATTVATEDAVQPGRVEVTPTPTTAESVPATATQVVVDTSPAPTYAFQLAGDVGVHEGCDGGYIRGTVRAADGAPLAGVSVRAVDQWGNQLVGTSKADPLGEYDIPLYGAFGSYQVTVASGAQALSAPVTVFREEGGSTCLVVNWQQTQ